MSQRNGEEAIRQAARHLGYRRAGRVIQEELRSAINGAIRKGMLEYEGMMIRKSKPK